MKSTIISVSILAALCAALSPSASAAGDDTWLGNTDNKWSTAANWSPSVNAPPTAGDSLFFGVAGSSGTSLNNDLANGTSFAGITFNSGASSFTLAGNPIVLAGGITNNSSTLQTVSLMFTNNGNPTFVANASGGNLLVNGGAAANTSGVTITGGGTVTLGGANAWLWGTTINGATLAFANDNAMPQNGQVAFSGSASYMDLAGKNQNVGNLVGNTGSGTGCYITNSAISLATLTLNLGTGNDYQFLNGVFGGNLKLVIVGNSINANWGGYSGYQMNLDGNSYSGGTVLQGVGTTPLSTLNLASAGGLIPATCTNTAILRANNGISIGTGSLTLDNGELWSTHALTLTNPIVVTSRGGILRSENNATVYNGPISGSGLLVFNSPSGTVNLNGSLSGFTGTLGVDTSSNPNTGLYALNISSNSPSGNLLFFGAGGRSGVVQWNGDTATPVTLSFGEVSAGVNGGSAAIGALSSAVAATLTYQLGDNTANTPVFGGVVQDGVAGGTVGVTKVGTDTQTLSGANTYSGPTAVNGGTLVLSGANTGVGGYTVANGAILSLGGSGSLASGVTVSAGGKLIGGGGTINGLVTLNSGNAAINLQDSVANALTLVGGLTLNNGNVLTLDVGDAIAITGGAYTKNAGTVTVNVSGNVSPNSTYNLITGAGIASTNGFILGTTPSGSGYSFTLVATGGNLALQANYTTPAPTVAFWKGGVNNTWSAADSGASFNWATTSVGTTTTGAKPGAPTAVTFSASGAANQSTVLGGNFEIASLSITTSGNVGIGGANSLQIDPAGLVIASGAGNVTISNSSLILGGSQLWTNKSADTLTVRAPISGLSVLTLGGGNTVWSGTNTHGGTVITAGTLTLSGSSTLGSSSAIVTADTGSINLGGSSQSVGPVSVLNGATIANGTITGTSYDLEAGTVSAVLGGGPSVQAVKTNTGTIVLSANNTFSGSLAISNGTVQVGAGGATGSLNPASLYIDAVAAFSVNSSGSQINDALITGSGPLTITGGGNVRLTHQVSTYSGNILVDGSALTASGGNNTANAPFGPLGTSTTARSITLTNGATLSLVGGNTLGSGVSTRCDITTAIEQGSQLVLAVANGNNGDANILGPIILNGGQLSVGNGWNSAFQGAILLGSVTVGGTNSSTIISSGSDAARDGVMLGYMGSDASVNLNGVGGLISFVVNTTGASNADLVVGASLVDPAYSPLTGGTVAGNGGIYKDGAGTMLVTNVNPYSGPTLVNAGKLIVSSIQGVTGMTNYVTVNDGGALGVLVSDGSQWSPSVVTLGTGAGATLEFAGINSTAIAPLNPGVMSLVGNLTINITSPIYAAGTYPLANNWDKSGTVSLGTLPAGNSATLDISTSTIKLVVTAVPLNPNPATINASFSGGTLTLSWPPDHKGWTLQTNSVGLAATNKWFPYPGSTSTTNVAIQINPTKTNVFFRLVLP